MKRIAIICQPEFFRFCYDNSLNGLFEVHEIPYKYNMSYEELSFIETIDADFNIFFRGEFVPDKLLSRLTGIKINLSSEPFPRFIDKKLNYSFDSFKRYFSFRGIKTKKFDYVFHYDEASLEFLKKDGLFLSGSFAFPVATELYKPDSQKKLWDLFFIGRSTDHREKYFSPLKHMYNFLHIAHGIWGKSLVDYLNSSRICLNIHAEDEISWEPRLQMLLSTGAFVISEKITPNPILRPNIDYVEIGSSRELHEAVEYYLCHPEECEAIAQNGLNRVRKFLDSRVVFKNLIDGIENNRYSRFYVGKGDMKIRIINKMYLLLNKLKNIFDR